MTPKITTPAKSNYNTSFPIRIPGGITDDLPKKTIIERALDNTSCQLKAGAKTPDPVAGAFVANLSEALMHKHTLTHGHRDTSYISMVNIIA